MGSKLFVGFLAVVVGLLLFTNPVAADAAMRHCAVKAETPRRVPMDPDATVAGSLICASAILPDIFTNVVCLQAKIGGSFVDVQ